MKESLPEVYFYAHYATVHIVSNTCVHRNASNYILKLSEHMVKMYRDKDSSLWLSDSVQFVH